MRIQDEMIKKSDATEIRKR